MSPAVVSVDSVPCQVRTVGIVEHSQESKERAFALFKKHKETGDIAVELSIPSATIRAWRQRYKWNERRDLEKLPGVNAESAAVIAKSGQLDSVSAPTNLELTEKQDRYQELSGDSALRIAEYAATLDGKELVAAADKLLKADAFARKALKLTEDKPSTIVQISLLSQPAEKRAVALETATIDI